MGLPEPYYQDEHATIYHARCEDVLPHLSGDLILTDPPYGIGFRDAAWDASLIDWLPLARSITERVIFTTAPVTLWDYPRPDWVLCWGRPASNSRSLLGGFNHWTPVLVYGKPKFPVDLLSLHAIQHAAPKWNTHPSPKPEALMRWLVEHGSKPGEAIVDPFMGSGTTLLAAKKLGRRAIGIEVEEKFCYLAAERLAAERSLLDHLVPPRPAQEVLAFGV